ncbi:MAG: DUF998 domain-containing protein [archaeon]
MKKHMVKKKKFEFSEDKKAEIISNNACPLCKLDFLDPAFFALIGLAIIFASIVVSMFLYSNDLQAYYDFSGQYLSELGVGNVALLFNLGLIAGSFCIIPFFFFLHKSGASFLRQLASYLGMAAFIFLIGVGLFPLNSIDMHRFTAMMFIFCASITSGIISTETLFHPKKAPLSFIIMFSLLGFTSCIVGIILLVAMNVPLMQKLAIALFMSWLGAFLLHEKINK